MRSLATRPGAALALFLALLAPASHQRALQAQEPSPQSRPRTVVLISLDGMRGDYANPTDMPRVAKLCAEGVSTAHLVPVFPSLTFPNHLSIATGVSVDKHGIVSNRFLDPTDQKIKDYPSDTALLGAKPLWVLTEEAGLRTALDQWPVGYGEWGGKRPSVQSEKFEPKRTDPETVVKLLDWLRLPDGERPRFLMLYFRGADKVGHTEGPDSPELKAKLKEIDAVLGGLVDSVRALPNAADISLVFVTDHGMAEVKKMINLDALWDREMLTGKYVTSGPVANVFEPEAAKQDKILAALATVPELKAWRAPDLPAEFRYRHARSGDIVALANEGNMFKDSAKGRDVIYTAKEPRGMHGYPGDLPSMHGFCLMLGAGFRPGVTLERASVLDIHPTVCALLGIAPGDVEGKALVAALAEAKKN